MTTCQNRKNDPFKGMGATWEGQGAGLKDYPFPPSFSQPGRPLSVWLLSVEKQVVNRLLPLRPPSPSQEDDLPPLKRKKVEKTILLPGPFNLSGQAAAFFHGLGDDLVGFLGSLSGSLGMEIRVDDLKAFYLPRRLELIPQVQAGFWPFGCFKGRKGYRNYFGNRLADLREVLAGQTLNGAGKASDLGIGRPEVVCRFGDLTLGPLGDLVSLLFPRLDVIWFGGSLSPGAVFLCPLVRSMRSPSFKEFTAPGRVCPGFQIPAGRLLFGWRAAQNRKYFCQLQPGTFLEFGLGVRQTGEAPFVHFYWPTGGRTNRIGGRPHSPTKLFCLFAADTFPKPFLKVYCENNFPFLAPCTILSRGFENRVEGFGPAEILNSGKHSDRDNSGHDLWGIFPLDDIFGEQQ